MIGAPAVAAARLTVYSVAVTATTRIDLPTSAALGAAVAVVTCLRNHGFSAYFVGGCVRDALLGLTPKDYDIATSARPRQVCAVFADVVQVGISFGVVRVRQPCDSGEVVEIEVATFRADGRYSDGRRPDSVRFADAQQDVLRRDFTINGLLLDPCGPAKGEIHDWVGGLADLRDRQLRAIGDPLKRFGEDALRLLRAPRFAARFGLQVHADTAAAIRRLAPTLAQVSVERITAELTAMVIAPTAPTALDLLVDLNLCTQLWPQLLAADPHLTAAKLRLVRARTELERPIARNHWPVSTALTLPLVLALLADDLRNWPDSAEFTRSWRLSRQDLAAVRQLIALVATCPLEPTPLERAPLLPPWPAPVARWLRQPLADAALIAVISRPGGHRWLQWRQARADWPHENAFPDLGFDGLTVQRWGYAPGPAFARALRAAEDVRLSGGSGEQAEAAARSVLQAAARAS